MFVSIGVNHRNLSISYVQTLEPLWEKFETKESKENGRKMGSIPGEIAFFFSSSPSLR